MKRTDLEKQVLELEDKLRREKATNAELRASSNWQYHQASIEIQKLVQSKFMGSGVIVEIRALGGKTLVEPVMLKDGLTQEFINLFLEHLVYSYELSTQFKPELPKRK